VSHGRTEIAPDDLVDGYQTTEKDRPLIDLVNQVGRHVVPLAVVDDAKRLLGVVPRAAVLASLAAPQRELKG
jgi:glycine betaine/proline transport system ATP-binding protein